MAIEGLKTGTILYGKSYSYKIDRILGSGSFGITYEANVFFGDSSSTATPLRVTIKEFFMRDFNGRNGDEVTVGSNEGFFRKYLEKFIQEADKLSNIASDGVVKVLESFKANNTYYYVMQYLSGGSLNDLISKRKYLPERYAMQFCLQIATALQEIHNERMLHLDLKPSNVMLSGSGDAVLIDFGLSKQYNAKGEPETSTSIGAGTRGYAPLEQSSYRDGKDFPVTMDIYALGATLYKMLTGEVPPDSSAILNNGFPLDKLSQNGISTIVSSFVKRLMSPMKKYRPQNIKQVISEINSIRFLINMAEKDELRQWIINPYFNRHKDTGQNGDDDTEVEVISFSHANFVSASFANLDNNVDEIELKIILNPEKSIDYNWISITATPSKFNLILSRKDKQSTERKSFFYTSEKFKTFIRELKLFNLTSGKINIQKSGFGISVRIIRNKTLDFFATTYEDGLSSSMLFGNVSELISFVWEQSGIKSKDAVNANKNFFSKILHLVSRR